MIFDLQFPNHFLSKVRFSRTAGPLFAAALLVFAVGHSCAQLPEAPETPFQKQLHKLDLSVSGVGEFNTTVTGPIVPKSASDYCNYTFDPLTGVSTPSNCGSNNITQFGSNTLGALVGIRYVAKPYIGFEFNYGYARYTENYTVAPLQIQTKVSEYTLGYVATPPRTIFGFQPWGAVGSGSIEFKPTAHGGQGAPKQARQVYYYGVGLQQDYGHLGVRAGFRQLFFLDPDFGQNYLTIVKHSSTYEPMVGFYLRY